MEADSEGSRLRRLPRPGERASGGAADPGIDELLGRGGRVSRRPRPERGGQDDAAQAPPRPDPAELGKRFRFRPPSPQREQADRLRPAIQGLGRGDLDPRAGHGPPRAWTGIDGDRGCPAKSGRPRSTRSWTRSAPSISPRPRSGNFPEGSGSACSWPRPCSRIRASSSSTSRWPASTSRARPRSSASSPSCAGRGRRPSSWSRTT